jgi:fatty acid desaturase
VLDAGRQILAFIAVTGAAIAVVDACSRTPLFPMFHYPGGAVLIYGVSMSLVWLTRQVVPFALPPEYYRPRPFESDGRLFRRLGVVTFKWLLFKSRVELLNFSARLSHGRSGLHGLERGIRQAETDHAIALLVMVVITIYAATNAWWALVGWLLLANVVANLYPIMLQRHNRARLLPILGRADRSNTEHASRSSDPQIAR